MNDVFAERIRQKLAELDWITRTGGLTVPIEIQDGETAKTVPAALAYEGAPCDAGDYLNMAPDGREVCIAFVEATADPQLIRRHTRYDEMSQAFRVVVWYDTRKIESSSDVDPGMHMVDQIITAVKSADLSIEGIGGAKMRFNSMQFTPEQIWARYNMRTTGQGLFMHPYRTFGLNFILMYRRNPNCITGSLTANAAAC